MGLRDYLLRGTLLVGLAGEATGCADSVSSDASQAEQQLSTADNASAAKAAFNRPDARPPIENETTTPEPETRPGQSQLERQVGLNGGEHAAWKRYQYPIPLEDIEDIRTYDVYRRENDTYVARTGLLLLAKAGSYVRYQKSIFRFGNWVEETKVIAAGDEGPKSFPQCGRHVRLRHYLADEIPGIGDTIDTMYCNFDLRDAHAIKGARVHDGDILGTVGSTGERVTRPQLLLMVLSGDTDDYNTLHHPLAVLKTR
ncbi:hypothetical protein HY488_03525 [Candidatus Woesearchaeota archaeon]|nr:hypothetical protein [Candidatus Woesearchaeota archaeon]